VGMFGAGIVVASTAVSLAGSQLIERFRSILHPTATGVSTADGDLTRQQLWHTAGNVFSAHPLLGVGFGNLNPLLSSMVGNSTASTHAHNTYLQYCAEAGAAGGLALVALLVAAVRDVRPRVTRRAHDSIASGSAGAVAALAVCWLTDYTVRYTPVLLSMAVPFVLIVASRPRTTATLARPSTSSRA
jgi:O-antigen ligase